MVSGNDYSVMLKVIFEFRSRSSAGLVQLTILFVLQISHY